MRKLSCTTLFLSLALVSYSCAVKPLPLLSPAEVTYASDLGVDLAAMEKRDNGLYVQDLVLGDGALSKSGDTVQMDYTGWLPDGESFDSSIGRSPFTFTLGAGRVIQGWDLGVPGMKVGGKRRLIIPSNLGYGEGGIGSIPGNAVLIFDVEMRAIQ